jgi:DNA mismatch endonuclease (patch repair protein)
MSRVRGKDTSIERLVRSGLHKRGLRFRKHLKQLPGKPDIVFTRQKVAVFIDGDFWHGYRFSAWQHTISAFWQEKIGETRKRDQKSFRQLRRTGWRVIRLWQHQVKRDLDQCLARIIEEVQRARGLRVTK